MKKLMFAFCFTIGGMAVYAQQQDTTSTQGSQYPTQQQDQYPQPQDQQQEQYPTAMDGSQDQERERISSRDLPDAVKRSLEGTEYRGWLVNTAYRTSNSEMSSNDMSGQGMQGDTTSVYGSQGNQQSEDMGNQGMQSDTTGMSGQSGMNTQGEIYIIELKNGAQTKTVRFDAEGNALDDQGLDGQDDQN